MILSARLLLLLAVGGAITLAVMALYRTDYMGVFVLMAYCVLTVVPLVYLDMQARKRPEG